VVRVGSIARIPGPFIQTFADPLLEARLGDERYFIAAWDDTRFRIAWAWIARR
jgi:hypothetical protein